MRPSVGGFECLDECGHRGVAGSRQNECLRARRMAPSITSTSLGRPARRSSSIEGRASGRRPKSDVLHGIVEAQGRSGSPSHVVGLARARRGDEPGVRLGHHLADRPSEDRGRAAGTRCRSASPRPGDRRRRRSAPGPGARATPRRHARSARHRPVALAEANQLVPVMVCVPGRDQRCPEASGHPEGDAAVAEHVGGDIAEPRPFWIGSTTVAGPTSGRAERAASRTCIAFVAMMTRSTTPTSTDRSSHRSPRPCRRWRPRRGGRARGSPRRAPPRGRPPRPRCPRLPSKPA